MWTIVTLRVDHVVDVLSSSGGGISYAHDWFVQHGFAGDDVQDASSGAGKDWVYQYGEEGSNNMQALGGTGDGHIYQYGGPDADILYVASGGGDDFTVQRGGAGNDSMKYTDDVGNDTVIQQGGPGNDDISTEFSNDSDTATVEGGAGDDTLKLRISIGNNIGTMDGGPGQDTLEINPSYGFFFQVHDTLGTILYRTGTETDITVTHIEQIVYLPGIYPLHSRIHMVGGSVTNIDMLATFPNVGQTVTFTKQEGPVWATVTGGGTVQAIDGFINGRVTIAPPYNPVSPWSIGVKAADGLGVSVVAWISVVIDD